MVGRRSPGRRPRRKVPGRPCPRRRRHGRRRRGAPLWAARGRNVAVKFLLSRDALEPGRGRAVRPRGAGGGEDHQRARGPRPRRGHAGERRTVHRDGAPRRSPTSSRTRVQERGPLRRSTRASNSCSRPARPSPRRTPSGFVHRDLKPANLFCVDRRSDGIPLRQGPRLLDLEGIDPRRVRPCNSRYDADDDHDGVSARYMSPEQMESARGVDARIGTSWALGIILHELLTEPDAVPGRDAPRGSA